MALAAFLLPSFQSYADRDSATFKKLPKDKTFSLRSLSRETHYQISLPVGDSIEFELEEDLDQQIFWKVEGYDPKICQLRMNHRRKGMFEWFGSDRAEIKLLARSCGTTDVILFCSGKAFIIHFTAK